jgi:hypothetical protein
VLQVNLYAKPINLKYKFQITSIASCIEQKVGYLWDYY